MPAQRDGVGHIVSHAVAGNKAFLLADQMGSGKTLQSILAFKNLARMRHVRRMTILATASICKQWIDRLHKSDITVEWIKNGKHDIVGDCDVIITSYSLAINKHIEKQLREHTRGEMLLLDEAHKVKSTGYAPARIARVVYGLGYRQPPGIADIAKFTLALTGTPLPNGCLSELHGFMSVACDGSKQWLRYGKKFCGLYYNSYGDFWEITGNTNEDEWRELIEPHMLQRDVRTFAALPHLSHMTQRTTLSPKAIEKIHDMLDEDTAMKVLAAIEVGDEPEFGNFVQTMHAIGLAKVAPAIREARLLIRYGDPLVLFCKHKSVFAELEKGLKQHEVEYVKLHAEMDAQRRGKAINDFQNGNGKVFLSTIGVGAEGINLTRAAQSLFVEMDFVLARMDQAIARIHRIGQTRDCTINYLVANDTIDTTITDLLREKLNKLIKVRMQ